MNVAVRSLHPANLVAMLALEVKSWPQDVRASRAQLLDRLETFGEGFLGAFIGENLVGMASCQVVGFLPGDPLRSWSELTANGWPSKTHDQTGNCLHFVSICVAPQFRSRGIGRALNMARLQLAECLDLRFALTDARLPGLSAYLTADSGNTAEEYVKAALAGDISEPVVRMYRSLGFIPLGLIAHCMEADSESADYGLAMLKTLGGGASSE